MPYSRLKGQIALRWEPWLYNAHDWANGQIPLGVVHDPKTGDKYVLAYNSPAAINGCMGLYNFEGEHSTYLLDQSNSPDDFSLTGSSGSWVDTIFGRGYDFANADYFNNGSTQMCYIGDDTPGTIEFALYPRAGGFNNGGGFMGKGLSHPFMDLKSDFTGYRTRMSDTFYVTWINTRQAGIRKWQHVALVSNGSGDAQTAYQGYVNGVPGEMTVTATNGSYFTPTRLGQAYSTPYYFDGIMSGFRYCRRALSPGEFMHHYSLYNIIGGELSDHAVFFDPELGSAFGSTKSIHIVGEWNSENEANPYANIYVNSHKGVTSQGWTAAENDFSELHVGSFPLVDDNVSAMWIFDGRLTEAGYVPDISENGHDLSVQGSPDLINTQFGQLYDFDGVGVFFSTSVGLEDFASDLITIEMLHRPDNLNQWRGLWSLHENSTSDYVTVRCDGDQLQLLIEDDNSTKVSETPAATPAGKWHYSAWVFDGSYWYYYENGKKVTLATSSFGTSHLNPVWFDVGRTSWAERHYEGQMAFMRVSNVARSAGEISSSSNFLMGAQGAIQDLILPGYQG